MYHFAEASDTVAYIREPNDSIQLAHLLADKAKLDRKLFHCIIDQNGRRGTPHDCSKSLAGSVVPNL